MEIQLNIDTDRCVKCGKCVAVCPAKIIAQDSKDSAAKVLTTQGCIVCGHCVAVCKSGAVLHSEFPEERVHPVDYNLYPTPEQMMLLIKARRSNRAFSKKPIPPEKLDLILEAAHRAPTGSNSQKVEFTLVTDSEKLKLITEFVIEEFRKILKKLNNPFLKPILKRVMPEAYKYENTFESLIAEWEKGNDLILRGATAVILIHAPIINRLGSEDSNLAYQNGSLMAEALGVSQFYTGFVCVASKQNRTNTLARMLGINGNIHAGMALGLPAFRFPNYIDRKDIVVNKI